jgi:tripartite-type tricarboxylate transporter receptor subunit TctC
MKNRHRLLLPALLATALCAPWVRAQAPDWPKKPVRWIVPFAAGGTADAAARHVAKKLSERWGQQVVVDNKPGANTMIAASEAARAAPDGYTLFQPINSTLTVNQFAVSRLPYDGLRDFTPISVIAMVPLIFVANDTAPAKDMKALIEMARRSPDGITMGGGVVGVQLAAERFMRDAGVKFQYIPYKSGADVTKGLLTKEIHTGLDGVPAYPPHLKAGRLRALATNSPKRLTSLPDVPTLREIGLHNSESPMWHAVMAPAGLSPAIQKKIANDLREVLALPDLQQQMLELGLEPSWMGPDEFVELIKTESATLGPLVKELGIRME